MTATATKTTVTPTWTTTQIQETTVRVMMSHYMAMGKVAEKFGPEAHVEFQRALNHLKAEYLKTQGVKTPVELVKHMAEMETNVFGSTVTWWGDETKASLHYDNCACWNAMQKSGCVTPETEKQMGQGFANSIRLLGEEFGFKGELEFGDKTATMHFTRK
ncbi:MAG: hypothetical protein K2W95_06285 [Candidatus Obscuribacterales bacterium]|nr:hypothetical protein [Candidatus Obscuribacterales bacterium]